MLMIVLRPQVREVLERLNKYANLYLYTAGTERYGLAVAKALDPKGKYQLEKRFLSIWTGVVRTS